MQHIDDQDEVDQSAGWRTVRHSTPTAGQTDSDEDSENDRIHFIKSPSTRRGRRL